MSGMRDQETAQMGITNGLCLARLQWKETEPAAFPAPKTDPEKQQEAFA